MRFFQIAGLTLAVIAVLNFIQTSVELAIRDKVYACSEVTKTDPFNVQKKCGRA